MGNGTSTAFAYELDDDLSGLDHALSGAVNINFDYGYNKVHQVNLDTVSDGIYQWSPPSVENVAYTPNILNQYTAVGLATLVYDPKGNLLDDGSDVYTYDTLNRLLTADTDGDPITPPDVTYEYDPQGRRSAKNVGVQRTEYLLDEGEEIAEYDGATLLRRFVYDKDIDKPIVMIDESSGDRFYYHQNRLGSVVAFADDTGAVLEPYTYSPYGISTSFFVGNPFRYAGRRLDEETGLYYYRARYYAPALGRFLQSDPIGYAGGINLYAYVGNDPVNGTDPSGLLEITIRCGANHPPSCLFGDGSGPLGSSGSGSSGSGSSGGGAFEGEPSAFYSGGGVTFGTGVHENFWNPNPGGFRSPKASTEFGAMHAMSTAVWASGLSFEWMAETLAPYVPDNLLKTGVGAVNAVRGTATVAGGVVILGVGAAVGPLGVPADVAGTAAIALGVAGVLRGTRQIQESLDDPNGPAFRNLLGLLPFGQEFDDPGEPNILQFIEQKRFDFVERPIEAIGETVDQFFAFR